MSEKKLQSLANTLNGIDIVNFCMYCFRQYGTVLTAEQISKAEYYLA